MHKFSLKQEELPVTTKETPMYDTKEGISIFIKSLEGFNKLMHERHRAGYERNERLHEYVIFGKWWLDTCGNTSRGTPTFDDVDDVLTRDECWALPQMKEVSVSCNPDNGVPPAHIVCPVCQRSWSIENAFDTWVISRSDSFNLKDFVGQTLFEVQQVFRARTDAVYGPQLGMLIQNDKYIDLTPDPEFSSLVLNQKGWIGEREKLTNEHIIEEGDQTYFNIWEFYHKQCHRIRQNQREREKFEEIFKAAGFKEFLMKAIPNEYHGSSCLHCAEWYEVTTPFANFKIGWRKRVINIECKKIEVEKLFPDEKVTKWEGGIHAWGWDKAQEYLTEVYEELTQ